MTDKHKVGLTLGKFAPFHKGHQFLIETAISEVDELIVLIYDDPVLNIPLATRAGWIREIYPEILVIEGVNSPNDTGYTAEIMKIQEDYVLSILGNRTISHFYSSEPYGEHMSIALKALNRQVDVSRKTIPVSATKIRENPYQYKDFVHPKIYKDLITKAVLLGAPSTGKTTLTEQLAVHFNTQWMPEYGREYWEKHQINKRLTLEDLLKIAEIHIGKEDALVLQSNRFLFSDTNAITTYLFSLDYHGSALPELENLAKAAESRHDIIFLCDTDIPYDDTWDRSGEVKREVFQKIIIEDLEARNLKYHMLKGTVAERIEQVSKVLSAAENSKF
ncbi:cytidyltransferase [Flavobacterium circumlabens]|uniref:Cytidyltransferase n=1 Tax=Flavobacterium circumlabens TaxID=2133765 RepID=A0A4Y7UFU1_9FLAO|nr:AAA family ATPase [Flavobacterium circumlabens]TCN60104.1 NadR type nicotinamide-nucleotide adenylyltransferase [Flavobacterium circumlabens]TEB45333.1 cytidyltransferase [Flavobacterium circumlabens]